MNPTIRLPFKRYEIGKVFRDGPIKTGRLREFTQCDVDIVGIESQLAETELMLMAIDAFSKIGLEIEIQYNNRKLLTGMLQVLETPLDRISQAVLVLDKLEKIGFDSVMKELTEKDLPVNTISQIRQLLEADIDSILDFYSEMSKENIEIQQGMKELEELTSYIKYLGIEDQCRFNPFLARGLEIYTGTIYEVFLTNKSVASSIGSGGRYDNAIGGLLGTDEAFSTVGISFGLDVIYTALNLMEKSLPDDFQLDYYVIPINTQKESLSVASFLRQKGFNVELDMSTKKLGKSMERANKENVAKVIIIGEDVVHNNQFKMKDMRSGMRNDVNFLFG